MASAKHDLTILPTTFFSEGNSDTGASVYCVLVPVMTLFLYAMIGGLLHGLLVGLGVNADTVAKYSFYLLLPSIFVAVAAFAIRDYRRRAGGRVDVLSDGIAMSSLYYEFGVSYDQIADVRIVSERLKASCQLVLEDGRRHLILNEVASYQELAPALEVRLIPLLAEQLRREFDAGQPVRVSESRVRAFLRVVSGCVLACLSIMLFFLVPIITWIPGLKGSWLRIRQGWRGLTNGFTITREGIAGASFLGGFPRELSTVTHVTQNDIGMVVHFDDGSVRKSSLFATHAWVAAHWLSTFGLTNANAQTPLDRTDATHAAPDLM